MVLRTIASKERIEKKEKSKKKERKKRKEEKEEENNSRNIWKVIYKLNRFCSRLDLIICC